MLPALAESMRQAQAGQRAALERLLTGGALPMALRPLYEAKLRKTLQAQATLAAGGEAYGAMLGQASASYNDDKL